MNFLKRMTMLCDNCWLDIFCNYNFKKCFVLKIINEWFIYSAKLNEASNIWTDTDNHLNYSRQNFHSKNKVSIKIKIYLLSFSHIAPNLCTYSKYSLDSLEIEWILIGISETRISNRACMNIFEQNDWAWINCDKLE